MSDSTTTIQPNKPHLSPDDYTHEEAWGVVEALCNALEAKDFWLRHHSERVARYAAHMADSLDLSREDRVTLHYGALLHDIGNIGVADSILLKPGGLTEWELAEVKLHPIIGQKICRSLASLSSLIPLIRSHHERLNGSGYPEGLRGDEIPLLVRVLSICDVYDTLRSARAYRGAFSHEEAMEILRQEVIKGWWQSDLVERMQDFDTPQPSPILT